MDTKGKMITVQCNLLFEEYHDEEEMSFTHFYSLYSDLLFDQYHAERKMRFTHFYALYSCYVNSIVGKNDELCPIAMDMLYDAKTRWEIPVMEIEKMHKEGYEDICDEKLTISTERAFVQKMSDEIDLDNWDRNREKD